MMVLMLIGVIVGAVLGLRFKVLVLAPVICIALVIVAVDGVARGDELWRLAVSMIGIGTAVQVGYVLGIVIQLLMDSARSSHHSTVSLPTSPRISGPV
jgi:hypothetical protein